MAEGANLRVGGDLSSDEPGGGGGGSRGAHAPAEGARAVEPQQHSLKPTDAVRRSAHDLATTPRGMTESRGPGARPGKIFLPRIPRRPRAGRKFQKRRKTVSQEKEDATQFHDNDSSEDVYDLYNACNGIVINGLLDVTKLDDLSPEEAEVLNVQRLREVWEHTATACARCARIVMTLNLVRGKLREAAAEASEEFSEQVDVNVKDTIS